MICLLPHTSHTGGKESLSDLLQECLQVLMVGRRRLLALYCTLRWLSLIRVFPQRLQLSVDAGHFVHVKVVSTQKAVACDLSSEAKACCRCAQVANAVVCPHIVDEDLLVFLDGNHSVDCNVCRAENHSM